VPKQLVCEALIMTTTCLGPALAIHNSTSSSGDTARVLPGLWGHSESPSRIQTFRIQASGEGGGVLMQELLPRIHEALTMRHHHHWQKHSMQRLVQTRWSNATGSWGLARVHELQFLGDSKYVRIVLALQTFSRATQVSWPVIPSLLTAEPV